MDDVLAAVFSYLKFLQHAQINPFIFRELGAALESVYRFSREPNAIDNARQLTNYMLQYPSKYIVRAADYLFDAIMLLC